MSALDRHFRATVVRKSGHVSALASASGYRDYPRHRRARGFWWSILRATCRSLARRFFSRTGAVFISTHDGGADHHVLVVVIAGQQLANTVENTALRPSAETLIDRFPVAETLREIPPRTPSPKAVENRFDEQSIIFSGAAHVSFTPRQNVLDPLPLVVAYSKTLHRPAPPRADHP